ncbi:MAG: MbnP family protein [Wenyingzhuangia sp.]
MNFLKLYLVVVCTVALIISCSQNEISTKEGTQVSATLKFQHSLGLGDLLELTDTKSQKQSLTLDKFKYLISEVQFTTNDNENITLSNNDAAQLIDLDFADESNTVTVHLTDVPVGDYKSVSFGIGVSQEVANGSTEEQTKLMDLAEQDMQWAWNPNAYVFSKIEASNLNTESTVPTDLQVHIGNKGSFVGYRTVTMVFPETLSLDSKVSPSLHITVAIEKIFAPENPSKSVAFDAIGAHGGSSDVTSNFADNFASIFQVHHIHPTEQAIYLEDVAEGLNANEDSSSHTHSHE